MSSKIEPLAAHLGLQSDDLIPYGHDKAKIRLRVADRERRSDKPSRLVLVSAMTPTPSGEGKTTTSIGLTQGLHRLGRRAVAALREPSLGPVFGMKGGGTGGGSSQLVPSTEINLHFTGDLHAITAANNLLAALVDNHLHFGLTPPIDSRRVRWQRVMDMNDRALRRVVIGLGGASEGVPREAQFDITAASEVMAILCLASDYADLRKRLGRIVVAASPKRKPITADDLGATGPMMALLKDAMVPNLVQTTEGAPAIVHGGPFANIAHGCSSVIATRMAMGLADWTITEAGFGFDLGGEKFFHVKCRSAGLDPDVVVMVATVKALKWHGGATRETLEVANSAQTEAGLPNLARHLDSVAAFGKPVVVGLNRFHSDTDEEIAVVRRFCAERGVPFAVSDHFKRGGEGAIELAHAVESAVPETRTPWKPMYDLDDPIPAKIKAVAQGVYGAKDVVLSRKAQQDLRRLKAWGFTNLPICVAKTQSSLSDNAAVRGRPEGFEITVSRILENTGAGFLVVLTGELLRMPGLPRDPQSNRIDVADGEIVGVR